MTTKRLIPRSQLPKPRRQKAQCNHKPWVDSCPGDSANLAFPKPQKAAPAKRQRIARTPAPRRTSRPRKVRDTARAKWIREADRLFSLIVRRVDTRTDTGQCQCCSAFARLDCAHVISRRYMSVRWDFENAFRLCRSCHERAGSARLDGPSFMKTLYLHVRGHERWEALLLRASLRQAFGPETVAELRKVAASLGLEAK